MKHTASEYEAKALNAMTDTAQPGDFKKVPNLKKANVYAMLSIAANVEDALYILKQT